MISHLFYYDILKTNETEKGKYLKINKAYITF